MGGLKCFNCWWVCGGVLKQKGPAEIASFCVSDFIQGWGMQAKSNIYIFLFLMLFKGTRRWVEFKISLRNPRDGKIPLSSASSEKIANVLWKWTVSVLRSWEHGIWNHRLMQTYLQWSANLVSGDLTSID